MGPAGFKESLDSGFCGGGVETGNDKVGRQRAQGWLSEGSGQDDWRSGGHGLEKARVLERMVKVSFRRVGSE